MSGVIVIRLRDPDDGVEAGFAVLAARADDNHGARVLQCGDVAAGHCGVFLRATRG